MRAFGWVFAVLALLAVILASNSFYTVRQDQQALVLQFGEPKAVRNAPGEDQAGLYFKVPIAQQAILMDRKNLGLDVQNLKVLASDQRRLNVDAFVRWRISNPLKFYQRLRTESSAASQINRITESAIREALGTVPVPQIVSGQRASLMDRIRNTVNENLAEDGIDIIDVRILQADLPDEVAVGVYERMSSARRQEAEGIRASGEERARQIRAAAARDALVIEAQAREQAEIIKGEGDARRNEIYANAYNKDADFFRFYRSLIACERALAGTASGTRVVVAPENLNLCRVFEEQAGTR
ncbi:MAG: protease modulator HflC [Pseudomonadota bacterium]